MSASGNHTSIVWKFFTVNEDDGKKVTCKLCRCQLSRGGRNKKFHNTTNLRNHLRCKHKGVMEQAESRQRIINGTNDDDLVMEEGRRNSKRKNILYFTNSTLLRPKFRKTSKNMTTNGYSHEKVQEAANYLKSLVDFSPRIGIICGSGLSGLGEDVKNKIVVKYGDIPHYVTSTVAGHKGQLVFGDISGKHVMCMQGRFHPYEGYEPWKIALPIRVMKLLGVEIIIITNAAGGLNRAYNVGDFMILKDHISFPGLGGYNPLRGPNDDKFGPRFPAVTPAYDRDLQNLLRETSENLGFKDSTRSGVYCNVAGPSYETIAEMRMLLQLGADSIGMSTAQEVVAAAHAGMKVVVCSLITNKCILDYDSKESANHEEVLETGKKRADDMKKLITEFIKVLQLVIPNSE